MAKTTMSNKKNKSLSACNETKTTLLLKSLKIMNRKIEEKIQALYFIIKLEIWLKILD